MSVVRLMLRGGIFVAALTGCLVHAAAGEREQDPEDRFASVFMEHCAVCHGEHLEGEAQGTPLAGALQHGDSVDDLVRNISAGFPDRGMPAWAEVFDAQEIKSLALWIAEFRGGMLYTDFNITSELTLPETAIDSEHYRFTVETIAEGLDPLPYSLSVLPDGSMLVAEKMRGLRLVSPAGEVGRLVYGTPKVYDDVRDSSVGLQYGMGWLLDVAVHPDYADNGWIYLHYTDRCEGCNAVSRKLKRPVSMNALMRGRIRDGIWVDEEILWQADKVHYSPFSDVAAGGRLAFDPDGFVFMSIGMKSMDGIQDMTSPHGKVLRLHDDGRIPTDNPYANDPEVLQAIWSVGHRSPQGLEFDPETRALWETEHGPRGGDEINLLRPGRNYGWPLFSLGQNYDGSEVAYGRDKGSELELADIEQPVVNFTPSPAISSFVIYAGDLFPDWRGSFLVGSLKATDLYRVEIKEGRVRHQELLIDDLARIRDIETGINGEVVLLLEHASGGRIVRLVPAPDETLQARAGD